MRRFRVATSSLFLALTYCAAAATPYPGWKLRELVLGVNESHCFTLSLKRSQPGSYYQYTDSTFVTRFDLSSGEMVDKICARVTEYRDTTASGDWTATEVVADPAIDLHEYLVRNGVCYAYPWSLCDKYALNLSGDGLVAVDQHGATFVLIPLDVVLRRSRRKRMEDLKYAECLETTDQLLFAFREGLFCLEGESREFIIPIAKSEVRKALGRTPATRLPWPDRGGAAGP